MCSSQKWFSICSQLDSPIGIDTFSFQVQVATTITTEEYCQSKFKPKRNELYKFFIFYGWRRSYMYFVVYICIQYANHSEYIKTPDSYRHQTARHRFFFGRFGRFQTCIYTDFITFSPALFIQLLYTCHFLGKNE